MKPTNDAFDSGVVDVQDDTNFVTVLTLDIKDVFSVLIHGLVGAGGALGNLQVEWSDKPSAAANWTVYKVGVDWNTPDSTMPAATADLYTTAANGAFKILLNLTSPIRALRVSAKKAAANTTLRLTGSVSQF